MCAGAARASAWFGSKSSFLFNFNSGSPSRHNFACHGYYHHSWCCVCERASTLYSGQTCVHLWNDCSDDRTPTHKRKKLFSGGQENETRHQKMSSSSFHGGLPFQLTYYFCWVFFLRSAQDRESLKNRLHIRVQKSILCSNLVVQRANKR